MNILVVSVQGGDINRTILVKVLFRKIKYYVYMNVLYVSQLLILISCMHVCACACVRVCEVVGRHTNGKILMVKGSLNYKQLCEEHEANL